MQDAGPCCLFVVNFCRWLYLVTWFIHVVARRRRSRRRCPDSCVSSQRMAVPGGSVKTLRQG